MKEISELRSILGTFLVWNKARLDCFTRMLVALFVARTVNLSELAVTIASDTQISSRYKRLQRFFREFRMYYNPVAVFIFNVFLGKSASWVYWVIVSLRAQPYLISLINRELHFIFVSKRGP